MITLFSDAAGAQQLATKATDADGMASIRFERAGRTANTVYAAIAAPAGDYHAAGDKQAVTWDSQHRMTDAANAGDIVNLKAEINFGAATVETDFGGGVALGGWAISVTSDKSAGADAPAKLGANGMASYPEVVMADSLPVTYTVKMAGNQTAKDAKGNELDGGEKYEADSLMHAHNGLSLPAAVEMGMMEVTYITQTLKVYVHHERDQVQGYTGNILGGDERSSGRIDVEIRHLDANGRSRAFASSPASARVRKSESKGVVTFSNVPAAANVVVNADEVPDSTVTLLDPDELAAYEDVADNGITGGAFGTNGGYHHTVELCPLQRVDPSGQDHGECATFAYVNTYAVHGQAWKNAVYPDPANDGFKTYSLLHVAGTSVNMEPVDGKNLAGDPEYFTAAATNSRFTPQDDRKQFVWGRMAAGVYTVAVTPGWVAQRGGPGTATADLASHINPLAGDLRIDVTPTTGFVYGRVTDSDGFAVADVTVAVNGRTATSDASGRYAVEGFLAQTRRIGITTHRNKTFVQTNTAGHNPSTQVVEFAANTPRKHDIALVGATKTASVSGTVRSSGTGLPLKGVRIMVNGANPLGVPASGLKTDDNGLYTATVAAVGAGQTVTVTASMARMSFTPSSHEVSAVEGSAISGIDFTGFNHATVSGRVSTAGRPMDGVLVSATPAAGGAAVDTATTGVTGTYSLSVAFGQYDVRATKAGFTFNPATQRVNVGPGESKPIEDFAAVVVPSSVATLSALSLGDEVNLVPTFVDTTTVYTASATNAVEQVTVTATTTDPGATVAITGADADLAASGWQVNLAVGDNNVIEATVTAADGTTTEEYTVTVTRREPAAQDDADLASLSLSEGMLEPAFSSTQVAYNAEVANTVAQVTVTAATNHAGAKVAIVPADADDNEANGHQVNLTAGANTITVSVTAADGTTEKVYTITVNRGADVPSAPQQLAITSPASAALTVTWRAPANEGAEGINRYQYRVAPSQTWEDADPQGGEDASLVRMAAVTTGLVDGRASTIQVRAVASDDQVTVDSLIVAGDIASISGTAWPAVSTVGSDNGNIEEGDTVTVTVTLNSSAFFAPTRVTLSLAGAASASIEGPSTIAFQPGDLSKEVKVIAADNLTADDAADNTFTVSAKVAEAEAEGRAAVVSSAVTVNDDDEAPGQTNITLAGVAGGIDVTFAAPGSWGTGAEASRKYQYRYKITSASDDAAWSGWIDHLATVTTAAQIRGLINGVGYTVEAKAVTAAGSSDVVDQNANAGAEQ